MKSFLLKRETLTGAVLGLAALILYSITLAPDVLSHDSGEWQAAAATLGISHSPGSPAYIIIAWLFSLVPLGTTAARVNYFSVAVSAIGVAGVYAFVLLLLRRMLPAVVAACTLGVAGLWWSHASVATPYNAIPAIMAVMLSLLLIWREKGDVRVIWAGSLVFGFGLSVHPSLMFFLPTLIAGVFVLGPWRRILNARAIVLTVVLMMAGLSFYAYIPLRSSMDPEVAWGRVDTVSSFISYISASESRSQGHGVLKPPSMEELSGKLSDVVRQSYYPSFAFLVFGPAIVLFYPAVWPALKKIRRPLIFLAAGMLGHMLVVFAISGIYAQYYLPLLFYFSVWAGFSVFLIMTMGEAYISGGRARYVPVAVTGAIYFAVLAAGLPAAWDLANHRQDAGMRRVIDAVVAEAEPGAVVLANWDAYGGLVYAQKVERQRQDLRIYSVPQDEWRELLPQLRAENPGSTAPVVLALTLPVLQEGDDLAELGEPIHVSVKGRTHQDYAHGEPFPAAVQIFELR